MKLIRKINYMIIFLALVNCTGREFLTDYYEISWGDFYTQGRDGYCVGCQIRGESDQIIENVKLVRWNDKIIIVEQDNNQWFVFLANGDVLKCGNNDKIYGPLIQSQVDSILTEKKILHLQERIFIQ